jgi:hypothetical protein
VSISGTVEAGQTLTAVTTSLNGDGTITYQWKHGSTVIGTNSNTYQVTADDLTSAITVTVSRANNSGSVTSDPVFFAGLTELTGMVSITGIPRVGQPLMADTNSLDGDGPISYQWKRGSTDIGDDNYYYVVQAADVGSTITVTVTREGYFGSKTSDPTATVTIPPLTGSVSISGTPIVGQTLGINTSALGGVGVISSYQWKRVPSSGGTGTDIGTNGTYTVQAADVGNTITVTVTRSGYSGAVTSLPTATVTGIVNIAAIHGVTAPVTGAAPVSAITATAQYIGTVVWNPAPPGQFDAATEYRATITLTPTAGYTLQGVPMNFFTVAGATSASNAVNSGVITAFFPSTSEGNDD